MNRIYEKIIVALPDIIRSTVSSELGTVSSELGTAAS